MGNNNERKRDLARDREERMGHQFDGAKTGGRETNVGQTDVGGATGAQGVGTGGTIGGADAFLTGEQSAAGGGQDMLGENSPTLSTAEAQGSGREEASGQVLTGDQGGDGNFGGRTGSGTSAIAANNSSADLGASGEGSPGSDSDEPAIGPGGQSEIGGASDLGGGETGLGDGGSGFIGRNGNPDEGFAERGRGAPDGSQPEAIDEEDSSERSS